MDDLLGYLAIIVVAIVISILTAGAFVAFGPAIALGICTTAIAIAVIVVLALNKRRGKKEAAEIAQQKIQQEEKEAEQERERNQREQHNHELILELSASIEKYMSNIEPTSSAIDQLINYCNLVGGWYCHFPGKPPFFDNGFMGEITEEKSEITHGQYPIDWKTIDLGKFDRMVANYFAMTDQIIKLAEPYELLWKKRIFIAEFVTDHAKKLSKAITDTLKDTEE